METNPNANEHVSGRRALHLPQVESQVHLAGRWLMWLVGGLFLSAGIFGVSCAELIANPANEVWAVRVFFALFGLLGALALIGPIQSLLRPAYVRHAAGNVMAEVPREPVLLEGSVVYGRLTHELAKNDDDLEFRPRQQIRRNDKQLLFGFGVPFMVAFSGVLTWIFHRQQIAGGWIGAAMAGITLTLISGGAAMYLIGMIMRAGERRLTVLRIPQNGNELELDAPQLPKDFGTDLTAGLKWIFIGATERQQLTIPRGLVAAVQLCPWCFSVGRKQETNTYAAQGLVVLSSPDEEGVYHRLPILLTGDLVGAARLMQQLGAALQVPYLFHGDEQGWNEEQDRAKHRKPLTAGGVQS